MDFAKRLFTPRKKPSSGHSIDAPIRPVHSLYVVGDIHGRCDLARKMIARIDRDLEAEKLEKPMLIFVGDYIDRGEDSAGALDLLVELCAAMPDNVICLMGNHEKMLLDFLDRPEERGQRWLRNGGLQTLASFGVGGLTTTSSAERCAEASFDLVEALPEGMEDWLRSLPLTWTSGNICVTHAGVDPARAISQQDPNTLLWGHRDFFKIRRQDSLWIVHGHTIVDAASADMGRISVDTGACFTGHLTAAVITKENVRFIEER